MKIMLANPPGPWVRCRWDLKLSNSIMKYFAYPVRLAYATAVLRKHGYDAVMIDSTALEWNRARFLKEFRKIMPDVVIWETTASSFEYDIKTLKALRKIKPDVKIAASGYHATPCYKDCLKVGYHYVIVGECDYSILDLVKYLNKEMKGFPKGVAAKGHKLVPRELIKDLDELPWPERESLPMHKYNDPKLHGFNLVMISSRGCPYGCSWCTVDVYYRQRNYRMRDPKLVVDEMEYLWRKYRPDELYFDDDNFAVNEKHVVDICNEIIGRGLKIKWNCMVDANISDSLLKKMKAAGCTGVTIGAESADDAVLKHIAKGITRKDIVRFVDACRKFGLRSHLCWVLGMPYSTKKSDMETIKFALTIPSDTLQFSICTPYPGTEMYKWCEKHGYLVTDWKHFTGNVKSVVNLPGYTAKEISDIFEWANRQWQKKMLTRRPDIIFFHFYNLYKYQGLTGITAVASRSLKMLMGLKK